MSLEIAPFDNSAYKFLLDFHSRHIPLALFLRYSVILVEKCESSPTSPVSGACIGGGPIWISPASIPSCLLQRLQCIMNAATWTVYSTSKNEHIIPWLHQLHWLKAEQQLTSSSPSLFTNVYMDWNPAVLLMNSKWRWILKLTASVIIRFVCLTCLSTVSDCAFLVAAACTWNSLPQHITSTCSLSVFRARLKTHVFSLSFPILL